MIRLRRDRVAYISLWVIIGYLAMAGLCALGIIFTNYNLTSSEASYLAPSWDHWFGTDVFGRDVLARAAHGSVTSLTVGAVGTGLALLVGTLLGAIGGYFGGRADDFVVWLFTTVDTVPYILLVGALSFVLGPSLQTLCIAIGLTSWTGLSRLVRGEFFKHRDREYVQAARAVGASHQRCIFIHILPNVFHILLINFSLGFASAIKSEVILSFLGLGVEPGVPSWGMMINDSRQELARGVWWNLGAATLLMFFLLLAVNLLNDGLREALDPKLKNK